MPRRHTPRAHNGWQAGGGEFSGKVMQNGVQPVESWADLSAKDAYALIKRTGQDQNPWAIARDRNFRGQDGRRKPDDYFVGEFFGQDGDYVNDPLGN